MPSALREQAAAALSTRKGPAHLRGYVVGLTGAGASNGGQRRRLGELNGARTETHQAVERSSVIGAASRAASSATGPSAMTS